MKKSPVIHPFLFSIFPILAFYTHNIDQVSFSKTLLPSAITLGATFLLFLGLRIIFKDSKKAGLIVSILLFWFFAYGHVHNLTFQWRIGNFVVGRHRHLILPWFLLFTGAVYVAIKIRNDLHNLTTVLNVVAFSLVAVSLINISVYQFKTRNNRRIPVNAIEENEFPTDNPENEAIQPDIYYIILDAYANSTTLKEFWNYDNGEFIDYLTEKGFYVVSKSRSNYDWTYVSLASSLNMNYVTDLREILGARSMDYTEPLRMMRDNKVLRFLKSKGYTSIHFGPGYGPTDYNENADFNIRCRKGNELLFQLSQITVLKATPFVFAFWALYQREALICSFEDLAQVPQMEGPKFVFAHIIAPHHPFLFDADGLPIPITGLEDGVNYSNYITFLNRKIRNLIDVILSKSEIAPIIILQGDHGPYIFPRPIEWEHYKRERLKILNAYLLPSGGSDILYDSITPVNTFRAVFNLNFNTSYELLDDRSYSSIPDGSYGFIDITDQIKFD